jgi:hypothetical protein
MSVTPLVPGKSCTLQKMRSLDLLPGALAIVNYHVVVKMGLFNKIPSPAAEVYTKNRQEWEPQIPGAKQVEGAR